MSSTPVSGLRPSVPTLAEQLSQVGYATRSVAGNRLLAPELGLVRGFDSVAVYDDRDDLVLAQAQQWLAEDNEQPLFLFVNLLGSHLPYVQADSPGYSDEVALPLTATWAAPWVDTHPLGEQALRLNRIAEATLRSGDVGGSGRKGLEYVPVGHFALYQSEVWATNRLGALLQAWDERTIRGRVVITSDHGEHFGNGSARSWTRAQWVNTRVPLVVFAPGMVPQRIREPISQLHVANTLRTWAGGDHQRWLVVLVTWRKIQAKPTARSWTDPRWAEMVGGRFQHGERLVRSGDWALIAGMGPTILTAQDPLMLRDVSETCRVVRN